MAEEIKPIDKKPVAKKGCWCDIEKSHWFVKLFLAAVAAAFILTLGIIMADSDGRHRNKANFGYRLERGGNVMYFNKSVAGQCAKAGGCPMLQGFVPGSPAEIGTVQTFTAPTAGAYTVSGAMMVNPYELKDLAEVFVVNGTIVSVTDATITLIDATKTEKTINVSTETILKNGETTGKLSDLKAGDSVSVVDLPGADGVMSARLIRVLAK